MSSESAKNFCDSILNDIARQSDGQRRLDLMVNILRDIGAEVLNLRPEDLTSYAGRPASHVHAEILERHLLKAPLSLDRLSRMRLKGADRFRTLIESAGGAYTADQMAEVLGISVDAVKKRGQRGQLLAIKQGRDLRFPVFQLNSSKNEPLRGFDSILSFLWDMDPSQICLFFLQTSDGITAIDLLREGNVESVLALARAYLEQKST